MTASQFRLSEANAVVGVIEDGVVVGEEIEAKDPLCSTWCVHEFNDARITLSLEPLVPIDLVSNAVNVELKVRDRLMLSLVALAHSERGW